MARFFVFEPDMEEASARHILIPIHDFSLGGTERIAFRLAGEWVRRGRRVTILAGANDGPMRPQVPAGVGIEVLAEPVPRSTFSRLRLGAAMAGPAKALAPDAVFLIGNFHFAVAKALKQAMPAVPIVGKVSNPLVPAALGTGAVARALAGWWSGGVDRLVAMSPGLRDELAQLVPAKGTLAIPDPFLDDDVTVTARSGQPRKPLSLLFVGRLEPQKNPLLALATAARLRDLGEPFTLTMIGGGAMEPRVRKEIARLGLSEHVSLQGHVANPAPFFREADMLLMTSRYEGVPAVIGEALVAGMPFVATPCTAWLEGLVASDASLGTLVAAHDANELAEAVLHRAKQPFPTADSIEQAIGGHRLSAAAEVYLEVFDTLAREQRLT
ncbi:glycosyltransferase [Aurantiacibacter xanthus]|uniref:Glycosyltransferase n=1 Tax=Aurantiacibacter xanthus TaxID=1784712 RepID=A0A3A1P1D5_9SPHN|nr:glycosyltransferase [Aurantiacibacter xanthus]RIV80854.1 glycosyltransferase [Aurantiacibacter xanthus]